MNLQTAFGEKLLIIFAVLAAQVLPLDKVSAQDGPPDPLGIPPSPAQNYAVSAGGVDMRTGQYTYSSTDLQMGAVGGLSFTRDNGSNDFRIWQPMGQFSHNWHTYVTYKSVKGGEAIFNVGGSRGQQFRAGSNTNNFTAYAPNNRSSLQAFPTGSGPLDRYLVYTADDGTKVTFRPQVSLSDGANRGQILGGKSFYASKIEQPDGTTYILTYDAPTSNTPAFLRRVVSNAGYTMIFEWVTNPVDKFVSKVCMFNGAVDTVPASNSCSGSTYMASYTYSSNGYMTAAIDPSNVTQSFQSTYSPAAWTAAQNNWPNTNYSWTETYYHPGENSPYLTNSMYRYEFYEYVQSQNFAQGADYSYAWNIVEHHEYSMEVAGGTATRSDGKAVGVGYQQITRPGHTYGDSYVISEGPDEIVDELGRTKTSNYCITLTIGGGHGFPPTTGCAAVSARYWKYPDGNQSDYTYNGWGSVLSITEKPKPGSGEPDIVRTFSYDCSVVMNCRKPAAVTDGNGNTANASYSGVHGQILKKILPADTNGVRPETRYIYTQLYPWKKNGASYVASSPPIWMLTSEEYCKTSAADASGNCAAGSADEVITTYQYQAGNSSTPSNLFLKGVAVTADGTSQRSCFSYDKWGRKLSETQPLANLANCP